MTEMAGWILNSELEVTVIVSSLLMLGKLWRITAFLTFWHFLSIRVLECVQNKQICFKDQKPDWKFCLRCDLSLHFTSNIFTTKIEIERVYVSESWVLKQVSFNKTIPKFPKISKLHIESKVYYARILFKNLLLYTKKNFTKRLALPTYGVAVPGGNTMTS